jgi:hypothetical protein
MVVVVQAVRIASNFENKCGNNTKDESYLAGTGTILQIYLQCFPVF